MTRKKHRRRHHSVGVWPVGGLGQCGYCVGSGADPGCEAVHAGPACPCPVCGGDGGSVGAASVAGGDGAAVGDSGGSGVGGAGVVT